MDVFTNGFAYADPTPSTVALDALFEPTARWFEQRLGEPTLAQKIAWPVLAAGRNLLLSAPTGAGKTLAAFLPIIGSLIAERSSVTPGVRCVYVAPLKALAADARRNLDVVVRDLAAFHCGAGRLPRIGVRTGDTPAAERRAQRRDPPDILLTTPESLAVLLSDPRPFFRALRWIVVDEVHALAPTKRGADLAVSLERLSAAAVGPVQRVGLSATAAPLAVAARFLVGDERPCVIGRAADPSPLELTFAPVDGDGGFLTSLISRIAPELHTNRTTLIFTNARGLAERLAWGLRRTFPEWDEAIAVHHSALAADRRRDVEARFKRGDLRAVVSSTSLELGIDVGTVDLVILVHPPGEVVRLLQRVGRAGHGPGRIKRGLVLTASAAELLEAAVTGASSHAAQCEPLRLPAHPLDVLCQQLLGMAAAGACIPDEAFALVRRAGPYAALSRTDFDDCLRYLRGLDRDGRDWLPARLSHVADGFVVRDSRTARILRMNIGVILAEPTVAVVTPLPDDDGGPTDGATLQVGEVDQAFAERLQPGDRFLLDGRCLEFRRLADGAVLADEVVGRPLTPRWIGDGWPLSTELAARLYLLRVQAAEALREGPAALAALLRSEYRLGDDAAAALAAYFERQESVSEIPDGAAVLVEAVSCGDGAEWYVHTPLNRLANDALTRVAAHRLARDRGVSCETFVADLGFALFVTSAADASAPNLLRELLNPIRFAEDLDEALRSSAVLRERFQRVALTGLMLLRNPLSGGRRKVGGADWGERRLFDRVQGHDPDFVLIRQAAREVLTDLCDGPAALRYAADLQSRAIRCRHLARPSPFAESWTQPADGPAEEIETAAEALQRLHAALTGVAVDG